MRVSSNLDLQCSANSIRGLSVIVPRLTPTKSTSIAGAAREGNIEGRALRGKICHSFSPLATPLTAAKAESESAGD